MRGGQWRVWWLLLGLLGLATCSKQTLTGSAVPEACNFALPDRCDVCSTGETVCAHYVVRNGVCAAETCPPGPSWPDASVPSFDGPVDSPLTVIGPSYACGPAGAGLQCSCGPQPYSPAPINDAGQQQTFALPPDPATVVAYGSMAAFDALAVGRWQRTAGQAELTCEVFGVEFTADHRLMPLAIASDGSVQAISAQARSFTVTFDSAGAPDRLEIPGLSTNPPTFFDGGRSMYFLYAPWAANYVRAP